MNRAGPISSLKEEEEEENKRIKIYKNEMNNSIPAPVCLIKTHGNHFFPPHSVRGHIRQCHPSDSQRK